MKSSRRRVSRARLVAARCAVAILAVASCSLADALEAPRLMKEAAGPKAALDPGCPLEPNLTGDCGNLRYYNVCSGYIWLYTLPDVADEGAGVKFDGPCIVPGNVIERAITYWRNVSPGYGDIDVILDADTDDDGCPDYNLETNNRMDPGLRWNCTTYVDRYIPVDAEAIILRAEKNSGAAPSWATDGPFSEVCDPIGTQHSYYYGLNGQACVPWIGPTGRYDNFLWWLIVDSAPTSSIESTSWGVVKNLFR